MSSPFSKIPASARALTAIGDSTAQAVVELFQAKQTSLFPPFDDPAFRDLADAFHKRRWTDEDAAELIRAYASAISAGRKLDVRSITRWVLAHGDQTPASTVVDCINVEPPPEVEIIRVLSRKGSQKVVFLASWRLRQQEVVLKRIIGSTDHVEKVLSRELEPHPLNMVHPNIIETHILRNGKGESFLVERYLRDVLHDRWEAQGLHEAANLLSDITKAVRFLQDHGRVHGDIKPDNIGIRQGRYVLLDFGICRPAEEFAAAATPTGSLRTRAPELLIEQQYDDPCKVDIWALGATVFNATVRRFPLLDSDEQIPRISHPQERKAFELKLAERVRREWDQWVKFDRVPPPIRSLLEAMLRRSPNDRPTAAALLKRIDAELAAFLRADSVVSGVSGSRFSPHEEFVQISDFLRQRSTIDLVPTPRRRQLIDRLRELHGLPGFSDNEKEKIDELIGALG